MEVPPSAFIGHADSSNVHRNPDEPAPTDLATVATPVINNNNKEGQTIEPNFLISQDLPANEEVGALVDTGANAAVTNVHRHLHNVHFHPKEKPCKKHMFGATDGKTQIAPIAKGFLRVPALTIQDHIDAECCCHPADRTF